MVNTSENLADSISKFCNFWSEQVIEIGNTFNKLYHHDGCALQNRIIDFLKENWIPKGSNGLTLSKLKEYIEKQIKSFMKLSKNPKVEQSSIASKINTYQHLLTILNGGIILK